MKKIVFSLFTSLLLVGFSSAATTVSVSGSAPTVDGDDIANLAAATSSQNIWSDRPIQGQTFTTGSSVGGYDLNSVTFQIFESDGTIGGFKDFLVRVSTLSLISGSNYTETPISGTVAARYTPSITSDNFVTLTFETPVALSASSLYGFSLGVTASGTGWQTGISSVRTTGDLYAGGQRYTGPNAGTLSGANSEDSAAVVLQSTGSGDLVFELDMTAAPIPEPSVLGLAGLSVLLMFRRRRA